jgi:hypothetical protein
MSTQAVQAALDLPITDKTKLLTMMVLCHHHNAKTGRCDPSQESLARETRSSVSTVRRHLIDFEASGYFKRERRYDAKGHRTRDAYDLKFLPVIQMTARHQNPTGQIGSPTGHTVTGNNEQEGVNKKKESAPSAATLSFVENKGKESDVSFDAFIKEYPKTGNTLESVARNAWNKLTADERTMALDGLPALIGECQQRNAGGKKWFHPVGAQKYLAEKRFADYANRANRASKQNDEAAPPWATMGFVAWKGRPQFDAWDDYKRKNDPLGRGLNETDLIDPVTGLRRLGWHVASEWPPGYEPKAQAAA